MRVLCLGLAILLCLSADNAVAGDLNEVGALLVYPVIITSPDTETLVTITNAGPDPVLAHFNYINGDDGPDSVGYCRECNFQIDLTGNDTETLVVRQDGNSGTVLVAEDSGLSFSCPFPHGMLVVSQEDGTFAPWNTLTDNTLLGEQVVVNYGAGSAYSIPAIPFQGKNPNDDFRNYSFDDSEYSKFPRVVAADFLAPRSDGTSSVGLGLFTLGFERQFPPLTDCSVTGFDAGENPFSASFQFGCWAITDLCAVSPEFCHPDLGLFNNDPHHPVSDTHGWLQLNCRVDSNPAAADGFEANGGVHGAIIQYQSAASTMPAGSGATIVTPASWGRLLYQSVTTGDPVMLKIQQHPFL
jgi:hypothetical protein